MAEWSHWQEWYRKCALAVCEAETRIALQRFADVRWRRYATVCAGKLLPQGNRFAVPAPDDAWHDFETMVRLRSTRRGKAYKHWLFARISSQSGQQALDAIQGGASLIIRDVVRERFRREMPRRQTVSLNAPPPDAPVGTPPLQELLPSPVQPLEDVQQRDLDTLAAATAAWVCRRVLSRRSRIAMLAREWGIPSTHPAVRDAAGCGKSVLYTAYHEALQSIAETVNARFRRDDRETRATLAVATLRALKPELISWAKSEALMTEVIPAQCPVTSGRQRQTV